MIIENKSDSKRTREAVHLYPIPNDHGYFNSKKKTIMVTFASNRNRRYSRLHLLLQQKQEVLASFHLLAQISIANNSVPSPR